MKACKTEATRESCSLAINEFMKYLQIPNMDYDRLVNKNPNEIQEDICNFIIDFSKNHAPASVSLYVAGIQKFYVMNDVTLNWKLIRNYEPEDGRVAEDRPYNHTEIKQMIDRSELRNKAIILLMSSSALRVGAIPYLRIKDIEHIEKYNIFKVNVYAKTRQNYFTFCTPECATILKEYIEYRERFSERITPDSPLFRLDYSVKVNQPKGVKPITRDAIMKFINSLWVDLGFHQISFESNPIKRNHIMKCHGFRKFFETNTFKAGMDHIYIRRLMGQKSGLEDSYLKLSEEELLEGDDRHVGYADIMDQLTINEENRLRREKWRT
jgi:integrase